MPAPTSTPDFGPSTQQFDVAFTREALPPGTRLGGYQIIDVLGRGGFGIVYLALDSSLQRQVAIKEYLPAELAMRRQSPHVALKPGADATAYENGMQAFLNEAKLLARFDHPSLARVHSYWEENRTAYMVMPYYDGHTLTIALKATSRPPDEAWLRAMLVPLLDALHVLHGAQCYHRDISPDNIFLLANGRPVLLDFGAANRVAGDKTVSLSALLNPAYAPIEQYSESATLPQGPWTDIYALAGVLHFAITGQAPARATVRAVDDPQRPLAETVRGLQHRFPGLRYSDSFLSTIDKALSVKPRERQRSVSEFQAGLDRSTAAPAPAAAPPAPPAPPASAAPAPAAAAAATPASAPAPSPTNEPAWPATPPALQPTMGHARNEPVFHSPPHRDEWFSADPTSRAEPPRSRAPLWVAAVCIAALAGIGGWWWTQMSPLSPLASLAPLWSRVVAATRPATVAPVVPAAVSPVIDLPASAPAAVAAAASQALPTAQAPAPLAAASGPVAASAVSPAPPASPAPAAAVVAPPVEAAAPVPVPQPEPAPPSKTVKTVVAAAEPDNPRGMCGTRANFALVYCMQTQCNRPRFSQHPQCLDLRRRGEIK